MKQFAVYSLVLMLLLACNAPNSTAQSEHAYTNALIHESSPYLLQHAHNPVNWNPWKAEVLERAQKEDKMLLISVGYSACHWCHVMEHESFEDTTVARIMNEHFIPIKIDREERPDVDDVYMSACHLATNKSCGWPLNAFALPDGRPVWAGTYFPKKGWMEVLTYFVDAYQKDRSKMEEYATQLTQGVQTSGQVQFNSSAPDFSAEKLETSTKNFLSTIDMQRGGRKGAPKFPMPNNYQYLLKSHYQTGNTKALDAVLTTLDNMAFGGIYDHLGGGFARYSVDDRWHVPHFEKMLYDNGQLVSLYAQAYQLTKKPLYKQVLVETLDFIERELTHPEGGFYSSLDADSEGVEGKFYVWSKSEIDSLLGDEQTAKIFNDYYQVSERGNWEHTNILYRHAENTKIAEKYSISEAELVKLLSDAKATLFEVRSTRIRPGLDDKVLTAWNGLMLQGYIDAYKALGDEKYLATALKNANFLTNTMLQSDHRLNRNFKDGKSVINAFLDDYALLMQAFTSLYEVTFEEKWLYEARDLLDYTLAHFYDSETGLFNYTSDLDPPLIAQKQETSDNVIPGSNSMMARNLHRLGLYFYNSDYLGKATQMLNNMSSTLETSESPSFYSNWLQLYQDMVQPPYEVAILGEEAAAKRDVLMQNYLPNAILLGGKDEGTLELLKNKLQDESMIYVCQNKVCNLPTTDVSQALKQLLPK